MTFGQSHNFIDILPNNPNFNRAGLNLTGIPLLYPDAVQIDSPPQFVFNGGRIANGPNIGSNNAPFYNFNTTRDWSVEPLEDLAVTQPEVRPLLAEQLQTAEQLRQQQRPLQLRQRRAEPPRHGLRLRQRGDRRLQHLQAGVGLHHWQVPLQQRRMVRAGQLEGDQPADARLRHALLLDSAAISTKICRRRTSCQTVSTRPMRRCFTVRFASARDPCGGDNRRAVDPRLLVPGFVADDVQHAWPASSSGGSCRTPVRSPTACCRPVKTICRRAFTTTVASTSRRASASPMTLRGDQTMVVRGGGGRVLTTARRATPSSTWCRIRRRPLQPTFNFGRMQQLNSGQVLLAPPNLVAIDLEGKVPTSYAYNLGVQYKLPFESVLDVSYVGTSGQHLLHRRNINAPTYGAAYLPANQDPTKTQPARPSARKRCRWTSCARSRASARSQYIEPCRQLELPLAADLAQAPLTPKGCCWA